MKNIEDILFKETIKGTFFGYIAIRNVKPDHFISILLKPRRKMFANEAVITGNKNTFQNISFNFS